MSQNRVFGEILQRIGGAGRYQKRNLAIWSLIYLFGGAALFFNAFLYYQSNYQCPTALGLSMKECQKYVCTLPQQERAAFITNQPSSLASKFGDYRCEGSDELSLLQSSIYFGGILGVTLGALLSEAITKKKMIIFTVFANFIGILMAIVSPNIFAASVGLFINQAAICCQIQVIVCFIAESVYENEIGYQLIIIYTTFGIGTVVNGIFFKIIPRWEYVLILYISIQLIGGLLLIFYVQQAPIDLILNYPPEYSSQVLNKIALINNMDNVNLITIEEIQCIKSQYQQNQQKKHNYALSVIDLFRYDSLRLYSILLITLHLLMNFQFVAPQLALQDYELSIYVNGAIVGMSDIIGCGATYILIDSFSRKKIIYVTQIISLVVCILLITEFTCANLKECSQTVKIIQSIGVFIFRFTSAVAVNFFYIVKLQIFPSQIKDIGVLSTAVSKQIGSICVPIVMYFCKSTNISIFYVFGLSCVLVMACFLKIPQTLGTSPPEMIQELKYQHHQLQKTYKIL